MEPAANAILHSRIPRTLLGRLRGCGRNRMSRRGLWRRDVRRFGDHVNAIAFEGIGFSKQFAIFVFDK